MAPLRDASELLWPAVQETLAALDLGSEHAAARRLAQRYAQVIDGLPDHDEYTSERAHDQAWALRWIGPLLLDALVQLGATPAARAAIDKTVKPGGGSQPDAPESQLDRLRASRAARRAPGH
jgi:hypothetical protein